MRSESEVEKPLCPRCGEVVNWFEKRKVGNQVYIYAVHYMGKKRVRKCYLGPASNYEYVSRLHTREGLSFYGLTNKDRFLEYLDALLDILPSLVNKKNEKMEELMEKMEKTLQELKSLRKQ